MGGVNFARGTENVRRRPESYRRGYRFMGFKSSMDLHAYISSSNVQVRREERSKPT